LRGAPDEQSACVFADSDLVFLGVRTVLDRRCGWSGVSSTGEPSSFAQLLLQGFLVGVSNPKTVVFLAAILPEFIARSAGHVSAQILFLGLIFSAIALVSDSLWGSPPVLRERGSRSAARARADRAPADWRSSPSVSGSRSQGARTEQHSPHAPSHRGPIRARRRRDRPRASASPSGRKRVRTSRDPSVS
jgi:hypothetical protein